MTVLFADVAGSARLYEHLGDVEAGHAVERCLKRITRCVEGCRGRTVQIDGDELLAAFDCAEDAGLAALDIQARIADLPPVSGYRLTIRIGLHSGMLSECPGTLTGMAVVTAARITGLAVPDQVIVSESVLASLPENLAGSASELPARGTVLEGEKSCRLYQLNWQQPAAPPHRGKEARAHQQLSIHYHGKTVTLEAGSPALTLGRDLASQLLIEDRRASRKHARIEPRAGGFFYIDSSTNGSFVSFLGQTESLLRHDEIRLASSGRICFGSSHNEAKSDFITFELH